MGEVDEVDQKIQTYTISHEYAMYIIGDIISHANKVMLKILKPGFRNTWIVNIQMFKLILQKAEES